MSEYGRLGKVKNRYLLVKYIMKPRDPSMTHVKGYMSDPKNIRWDEQISFSTGLKSKDQLNHNIILDIDGKDVVKNSMGNVTDWEPLWNYFYSNFTQEIMDYIVRTGGLRVDQQNPDPTQV